MNDFHGPIAAENRCFSLMHIVASDSEKITLGRQNAHMRHQTNQPIGHVMDERDPSNCVCAFSHEVDRYHQWHGMALYIF